jgi:hypothetical protein
LCCFVSHFKRVTIDNQFKIEDEADPVSSSSSVIIQNHVHFPGKCAQILSDDLQDQLDAAVYFRRILSSGRFNLIYSYQLLFWLILFVVNQLPEHNPPIAKFVENGVVMSRLVEFLYRSDCPTLQTEAAWALTNIACGEAYVVSFALSCHVLQGLISVFISPKTSTALKDQALWALCNISGHPEACYAMLQLPGFLEIILQQVGVQCVADTESTAALALLGSRCGTGTGVVTSLALSSWLQQQPQNFLDVCSLPSTFYQPLQLQYGSGGGGGKCSCHGGSIYTFVGEKRQRSDVYHPAPSKNVKNLICGVCQIDLKENPTLSAMRHVTFICGNLCRYLTYYFLLIDGCFLMFRVTNITF